MLDVIAFYLPQFHTIPENDAWWGQGFTEWTNTRKAKPLFKNHYQPRVPSDLGYYDLRDPDVKASQAELARSAGITGFCYYHYWFAGRELLEEPLDQVLATGEPDFPFCICWANETWSGVWHGSPKQVLIEQTYPGEEDHTKHFYRLLPMFSDPRYITFNSKPVILIYRGWEIPNSPDFIALWQQYAIKEGLNGLHFVAVHSANKNWDPYSDGYDAVLPINLPEKRPFLSWRQPLKKLRRNLEKRRGLPSTIDYDLAMQAAENSFKNTSYKIPRYPCVVPDWDNTARSGNSGLVLTGSSPTAYERHLSRSLDLLGLQKEDHKFLFIKSWNEWA
jgi:hypothetical protein